MLDSVSCGTLALPGSVSKRASEMRGVGHTLASNSLLFLLSNSILTVNLGFVGLF